MHSTPELEQEARRTFGKCGGRCGEAPCILWNKERDRRCLYQPRAIASELNRMDTPDETILLGFKVVRTEKGYFMARHTDGECTAYYDSANTMSYILDQWTRIEAKASIHADLTDTKPARTFHARDALRSVSPPTNLPGEHTKRK